MEVAASHGVVAVGEASAPTARPYPGEELTENFAAAAESPKPAIKRRTSLGKINLSAVLGKVCSSAGSPSLIDTKHADSIDSEEKYKRKPSLAKKLLQPRDESSRAEASPSPDIDTSEALEWGRRSNTDIEVNLMIPFSFVSGVGHLADGACCRCLRGQLGGRDVVLKSLKKGSSAIDSEDLGRELMVMQLLQHRNIVTFLGAGVMPQGGQFLAMEFLSRGTLSTALGTDSSEGSSWFWKVRVRSWFPKEEALRQAAGVAAALAYMHDDALPGAKIVHRDIKGCNLALSADGTVKLFDFGLATILRPRDLAGDNVYEMTGGTGSLRYMPPEVAKNLRANETADVYSFAMVVWEMIALDKPFLFYDPQGIWDQVINGSTRPRLSDDWNDELKDLLTSCWSADISERPCMKEVHQRLQRLATASS